VILAGKEIRKLNFGRANRPVLASLHRVPRSPAPSRGKERITMRIRLDLPNHLTQGDGKIVEMGITCVEAGAFMDETRMPGGIRQDTESLVRRALTVEAAEHSANALAIVGIYAPERGLEASNTNHSPRHD
jgi:hypothetical protein